MNLKELKARIREYENAVVERNRMHEVYIAVSTEKDFPKITAMLFDQWVHIPQAIAIDLLKAEYQTRCEHMEKLSDELGLEYEPYKESYQSAESADQHTPGR